MNEENSRGEIQMMMREALSEASKALHLNEVPVGAVVVRHGEIIARAHNRVEELQDASAHAELLAMRAAAEKLGNWRLTGCTLFSTLEPCPLCAGALLSFRVEKLVWGAPDLRQGADGSWMPLLSTPHPIHKKFSVVRGVLQEEASQLMKQFFQTKR